MKPSFEHLPLNAAYTDAPISSWMTTAPYTLRPNQTLKEVTELLNLHQIYSVPIVTDEQKMVGLITKSTLIQAYYKDCTLETPASYVMEKEFPYIHPDEKMEKAIQMQEGCLPVIEKNGKLAGIITRTDILKAHTFYLKHFRAAIDSVEILNLVLNSAYEGVVVIDCEGAILEFNEAYCRFVGKKREDIIGKDVRDIIENTRLHIVVKTGKEERGFIQRIQGHDMVVHRIPIRKGETVIGAIGMLIFQDVTELYHILGRVHTLEQHSTSSDDTRSEKDRYHLDKIIGKSPEIIKAKQLAKKAAHTPSTVLITGESGTGKEIFARAIHDMSAYAKGPLVSVNCSAIPDSLLESELFGYEDGAFTDARKGGKPGRFEQADNGTLFLDEIGDMPPIMQAKILRVLQDRVIERVGGTTRKKINVRIIAATNRDLENMVANGAFRADLYYRLNIIRLHLPPLSARQSDISEIISHFIERFSKQFGKDVKTFSPEAMAALERYGWPGNVREVMNISERLVSLVDAPLILPSDLPENILNVSNHAKTDSSMRRAMDQKEREILRHALEQTNGNKAAAARQLGIQRTTFYMKLKKYDLLT